MIAQPLTQNCHSLYEKREHVCFGVSPFNSYFSDEIIQELAIWGKNNFKSMNFFLPDLHSAYTLEALGYDSKDALKKAKSQGNYLANKVLKALYSVGFNYECSEKLLIRSHHLKENQRYQELHQKVLRAYSDNDQFKYSCLEASRWVLEKRIDSRKLTLEILESAVRYYLAEIPLFIDAAGIFDKPSSLFSYHQCIPEIAELYLGRENLSAVKKQGFLILKTFSEATTANEKFTSSLVNTASEASPTHLFP